jgi:hypothetical protein
MFDKQMPPELFPLLTLDAFHSITFHGIVGFTLGREGRSNTCLKEMRMVMC